ncbi:protein MEMO1-like [Halichondria panicea]|uniref:protein MEMO1-like n=1 Tax=Halichondria panicea TaxID=6063 RepID=UPI00312B946A
MSPRGNNYNFGEQKATMSKSRQALHAGSWYSNEGPVLDKQLEDWLGKADLIHTPARAIIAPHAGYAYSGPCAGYAYKQIDPSTVKRVFILGPSHHVYLPGCALSSLTHYHTPLYDLEIDQHIYSELRGSGEFEVMSQDMDEAEHSIEMHLPYVAKVMESRRDKFTVVPILVGSLKVKGEAEYGKLFSKYLLDPENLFIVSSDFCHWGKRFNYTRYNKADGPIHASIEAMDHVGMDKISALDSVGFTSYLEETRNTICGRHPIAVLLHAVDDITCHHDELQFSLKWVKYDQSSACKSLSDSSVSYASASLTIATKQ